MPMPLPPPDIAAQLAAVQTVLAQHLGENLLALHLYGSATDGGLKPHSDIDLMATVAEPLPEATRQALTQALLAHSAWPGHSAQLRALELTVVARSALVPWRYPPRRELQFGEWLREDIAAGRFEPAMADPDLALLLTQLRTHGLALQGPEAAVLFEAVPPADLRQALRDTIAQWNAAPDWHGEERQILLALARIWFSACTGRITTKEAAADWAAARLPEQHRVLLQDAAQAYRSGQDSAFAWPAARVAASILFCKAQVAAVLAHADGRPAPAQDMG